MMDETRPLSDGALDQALSDLGHRIAFPPTPDLTRTVRARIVPRPAAARRCWWPALAGRLAAACLVVLLTGAVTLALVPDARLALADWFGLRGVQIVLLTEPPAPPTTPVGPSLLLGHRTTLAEAREWTLFPLRVPAEASLGRPAEVYLREVTGGQLVTFIYPPRSDVPAAAETGVGVLLMQFQTDEDARLLAKGVGAEWGQLVYVGEQQGYWLEGHSQLFISPDPSVGLGAWPGRPSANVLLWEQDGVTYRLESALTRTQAIEIAETLVPAATIDD